MTTPRQAAQRGYLLVLTAACLWATIGLFYRGLVDDYGLSRQAVVAFRAGIAAVALLIGLAVGRPALLRIKLRDLPFFLAFGAIGVAGFYLAYIGAITSGSVAQAAVLLYTAPIWIALWSTFYDHERLEGRRILALVLAVAGCALVAQAYDPSQLRLNAAALIYGLLSGVTYAAYSLWSAAGTRHGYNAWTVVLYSLGIGAIILFASTPVRDTLEALRSPASWPLLIGVGVLPSLLAPICFTLGLQHVRTSSASILATLEPVVAAALAWAVLAESLAPLQLVGGACVLLAVLILVSARMRGATPEPRQASLATKLRSTDS